jgi:predicted DNA-binding protein (MmcQ/YjbR family)
MHFESFRAYCLAKKGVTEEFPFGPETAVYKVMGKMFSLADIDLFESVNLKVDPEMAIEQRERYEGVKPGYHMNKKHWNTIRIGLDVPDNLIYEWTENSYQLVVKGLSKTLKKELDSL